MLRNILFSCGGALLGFSIAGTIIDISVWITEKTTKKNVNPLTIISFYLPVQLGGLIAGGIIGYKYF